MTQQAYGNGDSRAHRSSEELRDDIAATRARMDDTLDAIAAKAHPRALLESATTMFRSNGNKSAPVVRGGRRVGYKLLDIVKANPIGSALVGAGLAWMIMRPRKDDDDYEYEYDYAEPAEETTIASGRFGDAYEEYEYDSGEYREPGRVPRVARERAGAAAHSGKRKLRGAAERARSRGAQAASSARARASQGAARAKEAGSSAVSGAGRLGRRAVRRGQRLAQRGGGRVAQAGRGAAEIASDHPLLTGLAAFAIGGVLAALVPKSRREDEWVGEYSDELRDEVRARGEQLVESGRQVAERTAHEVRDEIHEQHLDPQSMKQDAQAVAEDAKRAAEERGYTAQGMKERAQSVAERAGEAVRGTTGEGDETEPTRAHEDTTSRSSTS